MIRYPRHSGTFYPGTRAELCRLFENFEKEKVKKEISADPIGGIVPHAGYVFSGLTAYSTYSEIFSRRKFQNVIVLGPSHYAFLKGVALWPEGKWVTPLGEIDISTEITEPLKLKEPFVNSPELHRDEHSIEVQIPFLQFLNPDCKIVPLLVGDMDLPMIENAAQTLAELSQEYGALVIASSDLYHGYSHRECVETDNRTISTILDLDVKTFCDKAAKGEVMACGEIGIAILLNILKNLMKKTEGYLLHYTNSAEVTGSRGGYVVGYAGIIFGEKQ
jgi:AmmeMemoRadiSam system protein B